MGEKSPVEQARLAYDPKLPLKLQEMREWQFSQGSKTEAMRDGIEIERRFPQTYAQPMLHLDQSKERSSTPKRVGVVLSGGQAAGGHNVITGLHDGLKALHDKSVLIGFLDGPSGVVQGDYCELTEEVIRDFRNMGGFDLIGSGRTKIESGDQLAAAEKVCRDLALDGLVIVGGDDSNTNAAVLAEAFREAGCQTAVIGVPKTIDGDLKNEHIEVSFGFDTACKTFSETVGSLLRDAASAKKYWFFVKIMGRSASHIAVECALQTQPNCVLVGEEIFEKRWTLKEVTDRICDVICARAQEGKNYGAVLIPEGLIEFIPEFRELILQLNKKLAPGSSHMKEIEARLSLESRVDYIADQLTDAARSCYLALPGLIQNQLLLDRDPHGNVQVSKIETERLLIQTVEAELRHRQAQKMYVGSFSAQPYFCGYEGRSGFPSNFDAQYCYGLGHVAALLADEGATGYMACLKGLSSPVSNWEPVGLPITMLLHLEERNGKVKPVIRKAMVELGGPVFEKLSQEREEWQVADAYRYPGPVQFEGAEEVVDSITETLKLEQNELASLTQE